MRLDRGSECGVCVADPGHVRRDVEGRRELAAVLVGDRHAQLTRDELRAEVVWMTAQGAAPRPAPFDERSEVGDEPIMTGHQLVELAPCADVLILERLRLAG